MVDVHPGATVELPPIPLITTTETDRVTLEWEAGTMNLSGVSNGVEQVIIAEPNLWTLDTKAGLLRRSRN